MHGVKDCSLAVVAGVVVLLQQTAEAFQAQQHSILPLQVLGVCCLVDPAQQPEKQLGHLGRPLGRDLVEQCGHPIGGAAA